jgi:hypothetical protein
VLEYNYLFHLLLEALTLSASQLFLVSQTLLTAEITMALPSQENPSILDKLPSNVLALCLIFLDAKDVVNCRNVGATEFSISEKLIQLVVGLFRITRHGRHGY